MNLTDDFTRGGGSYSNRNASIIGKTPERQNKIVNVVNGIISNINQLEMMQGNSLRIEIGPASFFISRLNNSAKGLKNKVEVVLNDKCLGGAIAFHGDIQNDPDSPGILRRDVEVHSFQNTTELKTILPDLIERKIVNAPNQEPKQAEAQGYVPVPT